LKGATIGVKKRFSKLIRDNTTRFFFVSAKEKWEKNFRGGGSRRFAVLLDPPVKEESVKSLKTL
jgi:hypothetical protein